MNKYLRGSFQKFSFLTACIKVVFLVGALFCGNYANKKTCINLYNVVPKYGADTKYFDFVNPHATNGGTLKISSVSTFDGLNPFAIIGNNPAHIRLFCFARLFESSSEEIGVSYPYIAKSLEISADKKHITFHLNESACFSDGTPITAADVVWSFNFLIKINPMMLHYYRDVEKAEELDSHTVRFHSKNPKNKELVEILGQLDVFPSEFFKANMTENGGMNKPFPSSGPYKISTVDFGHLIVFERVKNWWGEKLPINVGLYNFDEIKLQFYRERNTAFQAFLAGDLNIWFESSAKQWYTAYNVPHVKDGKIIKQIIPDGAHQATSGFVFNLRHKKFQDIRVRKAISILFNFNSLNHSMFYNHYYRLNSYYGSAELAHKEVACGHELELLQSYKDQLPDDVFKDSFKNPSYESNFISREALQQSIDLLKAAGWQLKDQKLTNKAGEVFEIVIPYSDVAYETIILHMQRNFENVGIKVIPRHFDASTFSEMVEQFDYDMVHIHINQSHSLGNEQREYFGSESAKVKGSKNLAGIENKVIDDLIEKLVDAKDYYEMVDCAHAIDRVLSWNYYMIMNWQADGLNSAYWNIFDMPKQVVDSVPKSLPFPIFTWWIKAEQPKIAKPNGAFTKIKQTIKGWFS